MVKRGPKKRDFWVSLIDAVAMLHAEGLNGHPIGRIDRWIPNSTRTVYSKEPNGVHKVYYRRDAVIKFIEMLKAEVVERTLRPSFELPPPPDPLPDSFEDDDP